MMDVYRNNPEAKKEGCGLWLSVLVIEFRVFPAEPLNPAGRVHQFLLSGVKRVALGTDFNGHARPGRPDGQLIAACAFNNGFLVFRVDIFLHEAYLIALALKKLL
jgi:hypothetical protein